MPTATHRAAKQRAIPGNDIMDATSTVVICTRRKTKAESAAAALKVHAPRNKTKAGRCLARMRRRCRKTEKDSIADGQLCMSPTHMACPLRRARSGRDSGQDKVTMPWLQQGLRRKYVCPINSHKQAAATRCQQGNECHLLAIIGCCKFSTTLRSCPCQPPTSPS